MEGKLLVFTLLFLIWHGLYKLLNPKMEDNNIRGKFVVLHTLLGFIGGGLIGLVLSTFSGQIEIQTNYALAVGVILSIVFLIYSLYVRKEKIAKILLKKRLIACANIFEIESFYWWQKKIERAKEFVLIGKTIEKNYKKIKKEVEKIHPYEIPCVLKIKAEANEKYLNWLEGEIKIKRNE